MDEHDVSTVPHRRSVTECQLRRLVVSAPAAYAPSNRIDVIHEPDLDLLWKGPE